MQDLPFHTITQFAALGVTLIAGWFFGLATAPRGGRWRDRYHDEELAHAAYRDRAEQDIRDLTRKVRDLEAGNARAARAAPEPAPEPVHEGHSTGEVVGAAVAGAAVGAAAAHAVDTHHEEPAEPVAAHEEPHPAPAAETPAQAEAHHAEPAAEPHADHAEPADTHHH